MRVPVVQIRPMFMSVFIFRVRMPVGMILRFGQTIVQVVMMAVGMPVGMLMRHCIVAVKVTMTLAEQNRQGSRNNDRRQALETGKALAKDNH